MGDFGKGRGFLYERSGDKNMFTTPVKRTTNTTSILPYSYVAYPCKKVPSPPLIIVPNALHTKNEHKQQMQE